MLPILRHQCFSRVHPDFSFCYYNIFLWHSFFVSLSLTLSFPPSFFLSLPLHLLFIFLSFFLTSVSPLVPRPLLSAALLVPLYDVLRCQAVDDSGLLSGGAGEEGEGRGGGQVDAGRPQATDRGRGQVGMKSKTVFSHRSEIKRHQFRLVLETNGLFFVSVRF
jgi:hypothetical protein